jgi:hypothetical protein
MRMSARAARAPLGVVGDVAFAYSNKINAFALKERKGSYGVAFE